MDKTETEVVYADGTMFVDVLGNEAQIRILEVLLASPNTDYNISDIARLAGIECSTVYNHIDTLRRWDLVEKTRMAGNSPMYQINQDSDAAQSLAQFSWDLVDYFAAKEAAGEIDEKNRPILTDDE